MSAFIHKWANWSGNNSASASKDLTLPKLNGPQASAPVSDLKNVGSTNSPVKSMNTLPAVFLHLTRSPGDQSGSCGISN